MRLLLPLQTVSDSCRVFFKGCLGSVSQLFLRLVFSCFPGGQVAKLFQDSSLGNAVNIVVTRLILLMEDQVNKSLFKVAKPFICLSVLVPSTCTKPFPDQYA